jgi:hypothetical protein
MANYMKPENYHNMINALNAFSSQVTESVNKLFSISAACKQVLGDEDIIAKNLDPNVQAVANHYCNAARQASIIAAAMQQELEEYYEEIRKILAAQYDGDSDD